MGIAPLVSIISVNYKQTQVTTHFLDSLRKISYNNIEIIVVDNFSEEGVEDFLHQNYPEVKVIISDKNLGFAGGNNLGIKVAKGKYLVFLNNDTEVDAGFLEPLVEELEKNTAIGIASPKIIYYGTDNLIQYAGSDGINKYTTKGFKTGHLEKDEGQYNYIRETGLAHGAAMIVPLEVIKKVCMLPEIFFLYYEEHDWAEMIKRAGYKVFYIGTSKIYHKESVSVGKESKLKTYYMTRNRLLYSRRNTFGIELVTNLLFFSLFTIPKNTFKYIISRKFDLLGSFYKGILWNLAHFNVNVNQKLIQ